MLVDQDVLIGEGWDAQNGAFTLEAKVPTAAVEAVVNGTVPRLTITAEGSLSLKVVMRYCDGKCPVELVSFLGEGEPSSTAGGVMAGGTSCRRVSVAHRSIQRMLYGVWNTAGSTHRHLFALRWLGPLDSSERSGNSVRIGATVPV